MKRLSRIILYSLLVGCFLMGCVRTVPKEEELGENPSQIQNQSEEMREQDTQAELIDSSMLEEKKQNGEKSIVIVGDLKTEKYGKLLNTVSEVAQERDMEIYSLDLETIENQEWKKENDVSYEMNVAIMANGHKVVCGMETDEMYQKEVLERLVDTILASLN